jgi:hypothetical protein
MQKLKKALKKLVNLRSAKPAIAAKKAAPVKKKTQAIKAAKKPAPAKKAPAKTVVAKAAAPKAAGKAAKATKPEVSAKDSKAKKVQAAPASATAAKKGAEKSPEKSAEKHAAGKKAAAAPAAPAAGKDKKEKLAAKASTPADAAKADRAEIAKKESKAKKQVEEAAANAAPDEEVILTDAEGRRYCRVKDCDQISAVDSYCRYHYLLFWKNIQNRKKILSEGKLERYIEELTARYPDKYLEMLRKDLRSEKEFTAAIQELEIDESSVDSEYEDEAQSYLEEVRGMGGSTEAPARDDDDF